LTLVSKYPIIEETNLAEEKCNQEQIQMCFYAYQSKNWIT